MWRSYFADKPRIHARISAGSAAGRSVTEIQQRLLAEAAARSGGRFSQPTSDPDSLPGPTVHTAPLRPPDVATAHLLMQEHVECSVAACPRKASAYRVLIETGRIVPR
ncbi:hypothetical protein [Nocardia stercoris]|uniref:Uncharacterized protein n=1 Tax=Nocardia stercoris TaxID=2483361 RepID=A0A3M2LCV3_9NOCA|nr:hypothetical protein [Nocardia stercoris]RMI35369.1 hypothetical protein EBN03_03565 [Nocardia stercoris]